MRASMERCEHTCKPHGTPPGRERARPPPTKKTAQPYSPCRFLCDGEGERHVILLVSDTAGFTATMRASMERCEHTCKPHGTSPGRERARPPPTTKTSQPYSPCRFLCDGEGERHAILLVSDTAGFTATMRASMERCEHTCKPHGTPPGRERARPPRPRRPHNHTPRADSFATVKEKDMRFSLFRTQPDLLQPCVQAWNAASIRASLTARLRVASARDLHPTAKTVQPYFPC